MAQKEEQEWQRARQQKQAAAKHMLDRQMSEVNAKREAERQRKVQEAQELQDSIVNFQRDEMSRWEAEKQAQQTQWKMLRCGQA